MAITRSRVRALALISGAVAIGALTVGTGVAQADPWDPWIPGIPNLDGPGVNVGVPGNPLPPGQLKKLDDWIPGPGDLIPDWGRGNGKWR